MTAFDALLPSLDRVLDKALPDPAAREKAQARLMEMRGSHEARMLETSLSAILAEERSGDRWTSRARPAFLYVMYAMILWSLPMGLISAANPACAHAIIEGMTAYLRALPEPLYTLFGTGYLGYSALRQWGKTRGTER